MKVLHIVKTVVGAAWVLEQVRVLKRLGVEVVVALPSTDAGLAPEYRRAGAEVVGVNLDFPARRPWEIPAVLSACRRVVAKVQPDIIHSHHVGTTIVARLALGRDSGPYGRIPRIFQVPGPLHLESPFFAKLDLSLAGPRDYWIATCEWTRRKYLAMGIPPDRVFLSYVAGDLRGFSSSRKGQLRQELRIGYDVPLIGIVAYMYPPKWFLGQQRGLKGHEDFFAALNVARNECPNLRGVVIGGAWGGARWYEEQLRYRGNAMCGSALTFLGFRSDISELYSDLDAAVMASHSENCSNSALEALLSGVPVIATNVGGVPDVVRDGETGWLVPPQNPEALAGAILNALDDKHEARRRTKQGEKLARDLFEVERTAPEVLGVYRQILGSDVVSLDGKDPVASTDATAPVSRREIAANRFA